MPISKRILEGFLWLFLAVGVLLFSLILYVSYLIVESEANAAAFCRSFQIGDAFNPASQPDLKPLNSLIVNTQEDGTIHYSFPFPGFIFTYSSCDIQVRYNAVIDKELVKHND